jgi:hypothetical protein
MNALGDVHMTRISSLALGAALAFSTFALAHAQTAVTGAWKVSVGQNDAPCTLTLAADANSGATGTASPSADCGNGLSSIEHWKTVGTSLQLLSPNGELVAWLKPNGDAYTGTRVADGRKVALDR